MLPRWTDTTFYLEQDPRALLVVLDLQGVGRWLCYTGLAVLVPAIAELDTRWSVSSCDGHAAELYHVIRLTPQRIELFDESRGWGFRETLDL